MKINITEKFPHLSRAPIVEAVIEIRTNPEKPREENVLLEKLKERLPEYPKAEAQREFVQTFKMQPDSKSEADFKDLGLKGYRLQTEDNLQIAQFNKDGFVFSRLAPYADWNRFSNEAMRLWKIYKEYIPADSINRLGARFINKISLPANERNFKKYFKGLPQAPGDMDLPYSGFFHQDTLSVPDHQYTINIIRTVQQSPEPDKIHLILDIDVFTEKFFDDNENVLLGKLKEMQWFKNKIFFNSITKKTLEILK